MMPHIYIHSLLSASKQCMEKHEKLSPEEPFCKANKPGHAEGTGIQRGVARNAVMACHGYQYSMVQHYNILTMWHTKSE